MTTRRWATGMIVLDLCLLLGGIGATVVVAEPYLQLQGGIGFPARLRHFEGEYATQGHMSVSNLSLQRGLAYGAKLGYFSQSMPALGLEIDALHSTPGDMGQEYWITTRWNGLNTTSGAHEPTVRLRVDTITLQPVLRYPGETWQPYVAAGPMAIVANYGGDPTNTGLGVNVEAGVRIVLWQGLFVSASYRYQQAHLTFRESSGYDGSINGFNTFYQSQFALAGLGWNF